MIRNMAFADIPVLIALGAEMHEESVYRNLDFDPLKLWHLGDQIMANPDTHCAFVYEKDGEIIGFVAGYAMPHFFGNDLTSGDFAVYVDRRHRNGMVGVKLIKKYIQWCDTMGVKEPMLGVSAGITPERTGKLYERLGFTRKYLIYKRPAV